jgi:hypothetical protein
MLKLDNMNNAQKADNQFFLDHFDEFYDNYGPCYITIKDETVLGTYNSWVTALETAAKSHYPGSFILQECIRPGDEGKLKVEYMWGRPIVPVRVGA